MNNPSSLNNTDKIKSDLENLSSDQDRLQSDQKYGINNILQLVEKSKTQNSMFLHQGKLMTNDMDFLASRHALYSTNPLASSDEFHFVNQSPLSLPTHHLTESSDFKPSQLTSKQDDFVSFRAYDRNGKQKEDGDYKDDNGVSGSMPKQSETLGSGDKFRAEYGQSDFSGLTNSDGDKERTISSLVSTQNFISYQSALQPYNSESDGVEMSHSPDINLGKGNDINNNSNLIHMVQNSNNLQNPQNSSDSNPDEFKINYDNKISSIEKQQNYSKFSPNSKLSPNRVKDNIFDQHIQESVDISTKKNNSSSNHINEKDMVQNIRKKQNSELNQKNESIQRINQSPIKDFEDNIIDTLNSPIANEYFENENKSLKKKEQLNSKNENENEKIDNYHNHKYHSKSTIERPISKNKYKNIKEKTDAHKVKFKDLEKMSNEYKNEFSNNVRRNNNISTNSEKEIVSVKNNNKYNNNNKESILSDNKNKSQVTNLSNISLISDQNTFKNENTKVKQDFSPTHLDESQNNQKEQKKTSTEFQNNYIPVVLDISSKDENLDYKSKLRRKVISEKEKFLDEDLNPKVERKPKNIYSAAKEQPSTTKKNNISVPEVVNNFALPKEKQRPQKKSINIYKFNKDIKTPKVTIMTDKPKKYANAQMKTKQSQKQNVSINSISKIPTRNKSMISIDSNKENAYPNSPQDKLTINDISDNNFTDKQNQLERIEENNQRKHEPKIMSKVQSHTHINKINSASRDLPNNLSKPNQSVLMKKVQSQQKISTRDPIQPVRSNFSSNSSKNKDISRSDNRNYVEQNSKKSDSINNSNNNSNAALFNSNRTKSEINNQNSIKEKTSSRKCCSQRNAEKDQKKKYDDIKEKRQDVDKLLKLFAHHLKNCPCLESELVKLVK